MGVTRAATGLTKKAKRVGFSPAAKTNSVDDTYTAITRQQPTQQKQAGVSALSALSAGVRSNRETRTAGEPKQTESTTSSALSALNAGARANREARTDADPSRPSDSADLTVAPVAGTDNIHKSAADTPAQATVAPTTSNAAQPDRKQQERKWHPIIEQTYSAYRHIVDSCPPGIVLQYGNTGHLRCEGCGGGPYVQDIIGPKHFVDALHAGIDPANINSNNNELNNGLPSAPDHSGNNGRQVNLQSVQHGYTDFEMNGMGALRQTPFWASRRMSTWADCAGGPPKFNQPPQQPGGQGSGASQPQQQLGGQGSGPSQPPQQQPGGQGSGPSQPPQQQPGGQGSGPSQPPQQQPAGQGSGPSQVPQQQPSGQGSGVSQAQVAPQSNPLLGIQIEQAKGLVRQWMKSLHDGRDALVTALTGRSTVRNCWNHALQDPAHMVFFCDVQEKINWIMEWVSDGQLDGWDKQKLGPGEVYNNEYRLKGKDFNELWLVISNGDKFNLISNITFARIAVDRAKNTFSPPPPTLRRR
ncbi:hypothetical protein LTR65_004924 [Meristemomyces frigidus]